MLKLHHHMVVAVKFTYLICANFEKCITIITQIVLFINMAIFGHELLQPNMEYIYENLP